MSEQTAKLSEVARVFLKIGAVSYGGPAIMGIMQTEVQEKRQWIAKPQFVEGLALVNMLPGPGATQLAIFLGHDRAGIIGGILAGACFILPAFLIMLVLASAYVAFGALPSMRSAFYGIGPVVVGIFAVSIYRLGRATIRDMSQIVIAGATIAVTILTPVGLVFTLLAAGCIGIALFESKRKGLIGVAALVLLYALSYLLAPALTTSDAAVRSSGLPNIWALATFFLKVGALTFGGGLSMLAFIQEQVVNQLSWLTPQEFVDGLALGQFTPGPILMLAAFIGFKLFGLKGAMVATSAIFLPSFLMMLTVLPLLRKLRDLQWLKAFMRGIAPAVIGALAVSLLQMAPHAAPDLFTWCVLVLTIAIILLRNIGPLPLVSGGALLGLLSKGRAWEIVQGLAR